MFNRFFKKSDLTSKKVNLANHCLSINAPLSKILINYLSSQHPEYSFHSNNDQAAIQVRLGKTSFSNHPETFEIKSSAEKVMITANSVSGTWRGLNCVINLVRNRRLTQGIIEYKFHRDFTLGTYIFI